MSAKESDTLLVAHPAQRLDREKPESTRLPLVLVVDEDRSSWQALGVLLSERYRLVVCASALDAVAAFTEDTCAVIIDVRMSGQDGFWVCDQIRKVQPEVPVIFYSAYQDEKDSFEVINAHRPFAYVDKHGAAQKLLDALEKATRIFQSTLRSRRIIERLQRRRQEAV
ncbi:MAG TPA: response regulator [Sorangium sp.]|uniref:Transcriptional regulator n=1 Tax=Sorangium cellulosum TaxID=56 RepID=A0A150S4X3_SORCE|nr:transcriptional regulator [Sorangium cellulosum]HTN88490.1 response regulator [Sorangium sp.]